MYSRKIVHLISLGSYDLRIIYFSCEYYNNTLFFEAVKISIIKLDLRPL